MRLLLDTHIILWCAAVPEKLSDYIAEALKNDSNELWYSPISVWEIFLLAEKGHIDLGPDIEKSVRFIFQTIPLTEAPINLEVAIESRRITLPHQDPADRFLSATAAIYDLTLVTADPRIIASECAPILAAG